jgi:hypothetical protein
MSTADTTYPATDPVNAADNITTDAVLWYNVGIYGKIGYGVPNPSNDIGSLNPNIIEFTTLIGRSLFLIMHHEDVDLSTPPTVDTLLRIHQLIKRARVLVAARTRLDGEPALETDHVTPAGEVFRVWPVPFFNVRNPALKRWARWVLMLLSELFQHTQNRRTIEIYPAVGQTIGKYLNRVYFEMSTEYFGIARDTALAPAFLLSDANFTGYNPASFFTPTEMIDPVPALDNVFTEDRKAPLVRGIPMHELPKLQPYPANLVGLMEQMRAQRESGTNPDMGQPGTDGSRVQPVPAFPTGTRFI